MSPALFAIAQIVGDASTEVVCTPGTLKSRSACRLTPATLQVGPSDVEGRRRVDRVVFPLASGTIDLVWSEASPGARHWRLERCAPAESVG
jgi:hypothetical protein